MNSNGRDMSEEHFPELPKYGPEAKLLGTMKTSLPASAKSSAEIAMNTE